MLNIRLNGLDYCNHVTLHSQDIQEENIPEVGGGMRWGRTFLSRPNIHM